MRTTIDIPDALFKRAKAAAARAGTSLRDVVVRALEAHLGAAAPAAGAYRFDWEGVDLGTPPALLEQLLAERRDRGWIARGRKRRP